jgi:hypothetical protein
MTDHADFHDEPTAGNLFEDATDAPWLETAEALDADPWTAPATGEEPAADPWDEASWGDDAWAEPEPEGDGWEEDVRTEVADWGDEPLLEAAALPRRRSPLRRFAQLGAAAFAVLVVLTVVAGLLGGGSQPATRTTPTAVAVTPKPAPAAPRPTPRRAAPVVPAPTPTPTPAPTPTPTPAPSHRAAPASGGEFTFER